MSGPYEEPWSPENTEGACCMTCRFWRRDGLAGDDGFCRRYPPFTLPNGEWQPSTGWKDWCGEYAPKWGER